VTTTTTPIATCGNDVIEPGETCDGTVLGDGAPTCLHGGTMGCQPDCHGFDDSGCFACANGTREGPDIGGMEECDGNDIGVAVCADGPDGPYHGGTPGCSASCELVFGAGRCWRCGDGMLQPGEECDAGEGNGTSQNNCDSNCGLRCGDGIVQQGEQCDDGGQVDGDGCASVCLFEGGATWGGGTDDDMCAGEPGCVDCYAGWGVAGVPDPAPATACVDGAACDTDGTVNGACTVQYFYCLNRADTVAGGSAAPACAPRDVKRAALVTPPTDLDAADRDAFLDSVEGALGRFDGVTMRDDDGVTRTTRLNRGDVCGDARVTMPTGESRVLAVAITDSGNPVDSGTDQRTDRDELVFQCLPAS
jgi:cysteine-rich repeat protein